MPVLQEILAIYRNEPSKFEAINKLLFEAVQNHWLVDLKERYIRELSSGGLLKPTERYLDRRTRRCITSLASNKKDVAKINDIAYQEGIDFKAQQEDARTKVYADLGSTDGKTLNDSAKAYQRWFENNRDLQGWVHEILNASVPHGLHEASIPKGFTPTKGNSPTIWQYVDFYQAKVRLELGERRKILPSDKVDADTYACSPYYNVLVTQDKRFRETIKLVVGDSFELKDFKDFMQMLGVHLRA